MAKMCSKTRLSGIRRTHSTRPRRSCSLSRCYLILLIDIARQCSYQRPHFQGHECYRGDNVASRLCYYEAGSAIPSHFRISDNYGAKKKAREFNNAVADFQLTLGIKWPAKGKHKVAIRSSGIGFSLAQSHLTWEIRNIRL